MEEEDDNIPVLPSGFIHMNPSPVKIKSPVKSRFKRATWYTVKVPSPEDDTISDDIPVLCLQRFSPVPFVCFDTVKIGTTKTCKLLVKNPLNEFQHVNIEKFPQDKGFSLDIFDFTIYEKEVKTLEFSWTPTKEGNYREIVCFRTSTGCKTQALLLGTGKEVRRTKKKTSYKSSRTPQRKIVMKKNSPNFCTSIKNKSPKRQALLSRSNHGQKLKHDEKDYEAFKRKSILSNVDMSSFCSSPMKYEDSLPKCSENDPVTQLFASKDAEHSLPLTPLKRQTFSIHSPQDSPIFHRPVLKEIVSNGDTNPQIMSKPLYPKVQAQQVENLRNNRRCRWKIHRGTPKNIQSVLLKESNLNKLNIERNSPVDFRRVTFVKKPPSDEFNDSLEPSSGSSPLEDSLNKSPDFPANTSPKNEKEAENFQTSQFLIKDNECESLQINPVIMGEDTSPVMRRISSETVVLNDTVFPSDLLPQCDGEDKEFSVCNFKEPQFQQMNCEEPQIISKQYKNTSCYEEFEADGVALDSYLCSTGIKPHIPAFALQQQVSQCSSISSVKTHTLGFSSESPIKCDTYFSGHTEFGQINKVLPSRRKEFSSQSEDDGVINYHIQNSQSMLEGKCGRNVSQISNTEKYPLNCKEKCKETSVVTKKRGQKIQVTGQTNGKNLTTRKKNESAVTLSADGKLRTRQFIRNADGISTVPKRRPKTRIFTKGVVQTTLSLIKPVKTSIPRHPNPYAAQNMYYDERWMEKQELGFTRWLNFVLTPPEGLSTTSEITKVDAAKMWVESMRTTTIIRAPTNEDLSLKAYTALRRLNRLRRAACILYQSESTVEVLNRLEFEIETRKIMVRKDRAMHADVGIKKEILELLLSYNSLWLRIGLETLYGEIIPLQSNSDVLGLSHYIIRRLLNNPDISAKYAHPTVPHLYAQGYEEALKKFTVKKFLMLVYFLDKAKCVHLIDHNPCLFRKNADFKSSRELLLAFSREYLSGEGDITRHLRLIGYAVNVKQTPLEEFDYAVTNIAVDLRCGLRLGRVLELLLQQWNLCNKLRLPAISRLQKIHNNDVVLQTLTETDITIQGGITSRDIVDGHREKTLSLLWQIIFKTQIEILLDKKQLKKEIDFLVRNLKLRIQLEAMKRFDEESTISKVELDDYKNDGLYATNEALSLLLQWCRVVCAYYGIKVDNFTVSFSDGQVLCYLIHHYHPTVLEAKQIREKTTLTHLESLERKDGLDDSSSEDWMMTYSNSKEKSAAMEELLANERENLKLAFDKCQELGGIPIITRPHDMSNTIPDEKVVVTLVTYVNARLMDLGQEIRAARIIQLAWRRRHLYKQIARLKLETKAAIIIQRAVRKYLEEQKIKKHNQAAIIIQCACRCYLAKKKAQALQALKLLKHKIKMATIIQAAYRGYKSRELLKKKHRAAIILQSRVRGWLTRMSYRRMRKAAITIQQNYRAVKVGKFVRTQYLRKLNAAIVIQSYAKCWFVRKHFICQKKAAVVLQTAIRGWIAYSNYHKSKSLIIKVQQKFRATLKAKKVRSVYLQKKAATVTLQSWWRQIIARQNFLQKKQSVVTIQAVVRGFLVRKRFRVIKKAVHTIETRWKEMLLARQQRKHFLSLRRAAIVVQSALRGFLVRSHLKRKSQAAIFLQKNIRRFITRNKYHKIRQAAFIIQKKWRATLLSRKEREKFLMMKCAVIRIQAQFRGKKEWNEFKKIKQATLKIQAWFKMILARKRFVLLKQGVRRIEINRLAKLKGREQRASYLALKKAVVMAQAGYRGYAARKEYIRKRNAAIMIQSYFKGYFKRKIYKQLKSMTICMQQRFRAKLIGRMKHQEFQALKHFAIIVQAAFRGRRIRKVYFSQRKAAITLQSTYRAKRTRRNYLKLVSAVTTVQQHFRATQKAKQERKKFVELKMATIIVQSAYRGICARRRVKKLKAVRTLQAYIRGFILRKRFYRMNKACCTIQSYIRMHLQRKKYCKLRTATLSLQRRFRANSLAVKCRTEYMKLRRSCIIIQAFTRFIIQRKKFLYLKQCLIKIQANLKGHVARRRFIMMRNAALIIQKYFRAWRLKTEQRRCYLSTLKAVVVIQASVRCWLARKLYNKQRLSSILIQASFRGYHIKKKYLKLKNATSVIQKYYRFLCMGRKIRRNYLMTKSAVLCIQAFTRGWMVRREINLKNKAATRIQASVRALLCRRRYQLIKSSTIKIQSHYRAHLSAQKERKQFICIKNSAIIIQATIRCYLARKQYQYYITNIVKIQSFLRMSQVRTRYLMQKRSSIIIQSFVRMYLKRKEYVKLKQATLTLQNHLRATLLARSVRSSYHLKHSAVITIQSWWRGCLVRKHLSQLSKVTTVIQTVYRSWKTRQHFIALKKASVFIQETWRRKIIARRERQKFLQEKAAAIYLQSIYRRHLAKKHVRILRSSHKVVSVLRCVVARKRYLCMRTSAIRIQAWFRCILARREYRKKYNAAVTLQRHVKAYLIGSHQRQEFLCIKRNIVLIQAFVKGYLARRTYQKHVAARTVQAWYRGRCQQRRYLDFKKKVVYIQSWYRGCKERQLYLGVFKATLTLQRRRRATLMMRQEQKRYLVKQEAAICIQRWYRKLVFEQEVLAWCQMFGQCNSCLPLSQHQFSQMKKMNHAAIVIQTSVRAYLARRQLQVLKANREQYLQRITHVTSLHLCAIRIQRTYRAHTLHKLKEKQLHAVLLLQKWFQSCLQKIRYSKLRRSVVNFQRAARLHLQRRTQAAILLQAFTRSWLVRCKLAHEHKAATVIQAYWHGYKHRCKEQNKRLIVICNRLKFVTATATEDMKLGNRTKSALTYLMLHSNISRVLASLEHLDIVTKLSSACCEAIVENNAVETIFSLIQTCNRSIPHMDIIKLSANVLLNLSKYDKTVNAVWEVDDCLITVFDIMKIFREKGSHIFTKMCTLLWIFAQDPIKAKEMKSSLLVTQSICSFHFLTMRKQKMEKQRNLTKNKISSIASATFPLSTSTCLFGNVTQHQKNPIIQPDWVLGKNVMREFTDPVTAISGVMKSLGLKKK